MKKRDRGTLAPMMFGLLAACSTLVVIVITTALPGPTMAQLFRGLSYGAGHTDFRDIGGR